MRCHGCGKLGHTKKFCPAAAAPVDAPSRRRPREEPTQAVAELVDELTATANRFAEIVMELREELGLPPLPPRDRQPPPRAPRSEEELTCSGLAARLGLL